MKAVKEKSQEPLFVGCLLPFITHLLP